MAQSVITHCHFITKADFYSMDQIYKTIPLEFILNNTHEFVEFPSLTKILQSLKQKTKTKQTKKKTGKPDHTLVYFRKFTSSYHKIKHLLFYRQVTSTI